MKKIKLVVSDFHISKGRFLADGRKNLLEDFYEDDKFIEFLEYYSSGEFADYDVELICNGDFFNMLQVDYLDKFTDMISEQVSVAKIRSIIDGHPELFQAMAAFSSSPNRRVTFVVGNHDEALLWKKVQEEIKETISKRTLFFSDTYTFDRVLVTHGHRYEFIHHFNPNDFWYETPDKERYLRLPWGSYFVIDFLNRMKQERPFIDRVHPFSMYLKFAFFNDHFFFWKLLYNIVRFWFRNRTHRDPYRRREFKLSIGRLVEAMSHVPMAKGAEEILRRTHFQIVIMGHSHNKDYRMFNRHGEYFNTGTWLETISLDARNLGRTQERTFVLISYNRNGFPTAKLKQWIGKHKVEQDVQL